MQVVDALEETLERLLDAALDDGARVGGVRTQIAIVQRAQLYEQRRRERHHWKRGARRIYGTLLSNVVHTRERLRTHSHAVENQATDQFCSAKRPFTARTLRCIHDMRVTYNIQVHRGGHDAREQMQSTKLSCS